MSAPADDLEIFDLDRHCELPDDPQAIARELDDEGIAAALLVPDLLAAHHSWIEDTRAAIELARSANARWAGMDAKLRERLFPVALLPALDPAAAVAEIRHAAALGLRAAWIAPVAPSGGIHPAHAEFAPVWRALCAAGMLAYVHPSPWCPPGSESGHAALVARIAAPLGAAEAIGAALAPAMDCASLLMALLASGLLEELPELRLAFADCGTAWLPLALEKTEAALWLCHQDRPVCLDPGAVFDGGERLVAFEAGDGSLERMPERFARSGAWASASGGSAAQAVHALRRAGIAEPRIRALMGGNARRVLKL